MFLYLLENVIKNKFYIGVSNNLDRRLIEHNTNNKHYTGKINGIWKLKYILSLTVKTTHEKKKKD